MTELEAWTEVYAARTLRQQALLRTWPKIEESLRALSDLLKPGLSR